MVRSDGIVLASGSMSVTLSSMPRTRAREPALVLIHGGPGGTHHYFHPWFSRAAGFARIIYYDQRGCGLSEFAPGEEGVLRGAGGLGS